MNSQAGAIKKNGALPRVSANVPVVEALVEERSVDPLTLSVCSGTKGHGNNIIVHSKKGLFIENIH